MWLDLFQSGSIKYYFILRYRRDSIEKVRTAHFFILLIIAFTLYCSLWVGSCIVTTSSHVTFLFICLISCLLLSLMLLTFLLLSTRSCAEDSSFCIKFSRSFRPRITSLNLRNNLPCNGLVKNQLLSGLFLQCSIFIGKETILWN